jgi:hypothetical protein
MWQPWPSRGFSAAKKKKEMGYAVAQLVEALRHQPVGRGFDSQLVYWDFTLA